jgi:hypothetical protein
MMILMRESPCSSGLRETWRAAARTPRTIAEGVALLRRDRVLLALVAVELFWGLGMVTFEQRVPVHLPELVGGAVLTLAAPLYLPAWRQDRLAGHRSQEVARA